MRGQEKHGQVGVHNILNAKTRNEKENDIQEMYQEKMNHIIKEGHSPIYPAERGESLLIFPDE